MQYGDIVNDVLADFNEVQLTSSNFTSASGFHQVVKSAVNRALRRIYAQEQEWPFNYVLGSQVMTPLTTSYVFPTTATRIDWNSFRVLRNDSIPAVATKMGYLEYRDWLENKWPTDAQDDTGSGPEYVAEGKNLNWYVSPPPDKAYTINFDYWQQPLDCVNYTDIPTVPDRFKYVVIDGAKTYCYSFRQNTQEAQKAEQDFQAGIKVMRTELINSYLYVQDMRAPGR